MKFNIKDTFNKDLPSDPIMENSRRQVKKACFSYVSPIQTSNPKLVHVSKEMLENIGLSVSDGSSNEFLNVFTGNKVLPNTNPYAMCYGGHQFGSWAGQLGDGRAINLAEVEHNNERWTLQLKGAGETPYSRTADGLAVLRSSIREYLCSEAMHHLGVPTTRALSLFLTGDKVMRDVMYDGNQAYEKGAVVCRVANSFLRFGSYEIFAARQDLSTLKILVDYTIKHHYANFGAPSKETYLQFFKEVTRRSLEMVIHWQRVGFVHGVLNTDNMSILGLTIDYGPYGWLEGFDLGWTPNTTDRQHKRYRYGNQPEIVLWNLLQLANALYPLIDDTEGLQEILIDYKKEFQIKYLDMMKSKIGLFSEDKTDTLLIDDLVEVLQEEETDMTLFFRDLTIFNGTSIEHGFSSIESSFYDPAKISEAVRLRWHSWLKRYSDRLKLESISHQERKAKMNLINPKYVLRNYMAQLAIDAADNGDYSVVDELFNLLKDPYSEQPESEKWFAKRPEWARHKVGCSMLSCSS